MQVLDQFAWNQVAVSTLTRAILCLVFGLYLLRLRNKSAATKAATTFLLGLFVGTLCCDSLLRRSWMAGRTGKLYRVRGMVAVVVLFRRLHFHMAQADYSGWCMWVQPTERQINCF